MREPHLNIESTGLISKSAVVLKQIMILTKIRITVFVALTTAMGYILATDSLTPSFFYAVLGVFLMACSSGAFNQIQEWKYDSQMARTSTRPIPAGYFSVRSALYISAGLFAAGAYFLSVTGSLNAFWISAATYASYNLLYTPLKRVSSLAIIPGSLVGALPPLAGWAAAGGELTNGLILSVCSVLFLWQIPHFWLLLVKFNKQYIKAGYPTLLQKISMKTLFKLISFSTFITALSVLVVTLYIQSGITNLFLIGNCLFVSAAMLSIHISKKKNKITTAFICINLFNLFFIVILSMDKLINLSGF